MVAVLDDFSPSDFLLNIKEDSGRSTAPKFDVGTNLKLRPKFNEKDPHTCLCLFERVVDTWCLPNTEHTL